MSQIEKVRSEFREKVDLLLLELNDQNWSLNSRVSFYLLQGILITFFTFIWLEYAEIGGLYHWLFPIVAGSTITLLQFAATEIVLKMLHRNRINLRLFILISFFSLVLGFYGTYFTGLCGFICRVIGSYCPVIWQTSPPNLFLVFFKTVFVSWIIALVLLFQGIARKELSKELNSIKEINNGLLLRQAKPEKASQDISIQNQLEASKPTHSSDYLTIPHKNSTNRIAFNSIYYIVVEDHYCKIKLENDGILQEEWIRMSLKEVMKKLPSSRFVQTHRSFVANLQHVNKVKKDKQAYKVYFEGCSDYIPASRHRVQDFLPKLADLLQ